MKKNYFKLAAFFLLGITIGFTSCKDDDDPEKVAPTVINVDISSDNNEATIYFSEGVFSNNDKTGTLSAEDLTIALSGGKLSLASSNITHTAGASSATIALTYSGNYTDGSDLLTVSIAANAIFDGDGLAVAASDVNDNLNKGGIYTTVKVTENITSNTTWKEGNVYLLTKRIAVTSGVVLTIEPGVIVKGNPGTGSNATALLITRGAKIMAEGTAAKPIIFTSSADNIAPGQIATPNLNEDIDGGWGGLIILGKAPISPKGGAKEASIEGIPADDNNGKYGGSVKDDNSGTLKYVSFRHGGSNIGEGNEINGLTLGGVGSKTTIEYVEIVATQDDGIEFFGGTVNVTNALIWNNGDDAIDGDQAWNGILDNCIIINPGDEAFELDGPEDSYVDGNYTIKNVSVNVLGAEGLVDNDANTNVNMNNVFFFGLAEGVDYQDFDEMPTTYTCTFTNFEIVLPTGNTVANHFPEDQSFVTAVTTATVGADKTKFEGWTFADTKGQLADF